MSCDASLSRPRGAFAAIAAALLAAILFIGGQTAWADEYPPGYPKLGTRDETVPGLTLAGGQGTQLFTVHTDADNGAIQAYCIELEVSIRFGSELSVEGWDAFPGDNKFKTDPAVREMVAWIIQRSYPEVSVEELAVSAGIAGLTQKEAIAGTQAAIWHFTNDLAYEGLQNGSARDTESEEATRVGALFDYLTGEANIGLEETSGPSVDVVATDEVGVAGNLVGPVRIESTAATVAIEGLRHPLVNGGGEDIDPAAVPTGVDLYLKVPADATDGEQAIQVTVEGSAYSGQLLISTQGRSQTIIIGNNESKTVEDSAVLRWKAKPMPTPTPTPTPTPSPTVSETPTPKPMPSKTAKPGKPGLPKTGD